jgi:DNA-binding NarL/FixJ family response regulator
MLSKQGGRTFRSCLAGIDSAELPGLISSLMLVGSTEPVTLPEIDVAAIGKLEPDIVVMNVDQLLLDPLESIRMTRFVLQSSVIAVFTGKLEHSWGRACHLAGANCLLSKRGSADQTALGLLHAMRSGCFTDPSFEAA